VPAIVINNIIAGIMGYASLSRANLRESSPLSGDLERIEQLSWRASDLTRALLAFARKGEFQPEPLDVGGIIGEVLKVVGRTAGKHGQRQRQPM